MSKWFSAHCKAAAIAVGLVLSGCGLPTFPQSATQQSGAPEAVRSTPRMDASPTVEPGEGRTSWRGADDATRQAVGNLRLSRPEPGRGRPLALAFASGVTVLLAPPSLHLSDEASGVGGSSFATLLDAEPQIEVFVYEVMQETVASSAAQGGLCGSRRATHVAAGEFVDASGEWVLKMVSFAADIRPGAQEGDPGLCRTFTFRPA